MLHELMDLYHLAHGTHTAANSEESTGARIHGGLHAAEGGAGLLGSLLTGGAHLGHLALGSIGTIAAEGGAVGAGTALSAGSSVLGAGLLGYGAGSLLNEYGGRALGGTQTVQGRGANGGTTQVADTRSISDRMADATHTATGDRMALGMAHYLPTFLGGDGW